ncbi:MFS transporter [Kibdelosporangium philippinense]|uniref:MFS transporter n=1 Tax=Kibdelosporangium philippinense TaxID=211113 RepID=A0ABS8ZAL3_9PSEU|nr:MFS transporter [Kibdelosporangium philippinense]MCE7004078.1 MFS transporter [Kibdelosporangium philippinense]
MIKRRGITIALIVLCQSSQALVTGGIALFLPLIRDDLALSFAQGGSLAAASTFTYALMQVPVGILADRIDPKKMLLIGLLGVNILACGFALLDSYGWLLANQAVSGIFRSMAFAPGLILISRQFDSSKQAMAMGLYVAGGFSSSIVLNLLGPLLVGPLGWQGVFLVCAGLGVLTLLAYWLIGNDGADPRPRKQPPLRELPKLLKHPVVAVTSVIQFVRLAATHGVITWLPSFVVVEKGYSIQTAGFLVALGAALTAPSNIMGGYVADKTGKPLAVVWVSLTIIAASLVGLVLADSLPMIIAMVAVNSIVIQLYFGPLFSIPIQYLGRSVAGAISGFGNFWANLGGFTAVWALGALKDATGAFDAGFLLLTGFCVIGIGAVLVLRKIPVQALESTPSK